MSLLDRIRRRRYVGAESNAVCLVRLKFDTRAVSGSRIDAKGDGTEKRLISAFVYAITFTVSRVGLIEELNLDPAAPLERATNVPKPVRLPIIAHPVHSPSTADVADHEGSRAKA